MLGRRDPQRGLFGARARLVPPKAVRELGVYSNLADDWPTLFKDDDFAPCYSPDGRPSKPPSVLATCKLLQEYEGISNREVVRRTRFDLRWKLVFDLDPCSVEPLFARSTYEEFLARLALHEKDGIAFEKSVRRAVDTGVVSKEILLALDGSPVRGRGALKDAFNLVSDAIAKIVRRIAREEKKKAEEVAREVEVERHLKKGSIKGSEFVDWDDQQSVSQFIARLLNDGARAVAAAERLGCAGEEVALLRRVITENVDQSGDQPKIAKGVVRERTTSVHDPEMKHGHKSNGKLYTGHKAHFAVDTESEIITAIHVTAPAEAEGAQVATLVEQTRALTGAEVTEALADCAYSSRKAQEQAGEAKIELRTKMPSPPKGRYGPRDFDVSEDGETATCPAGHSSDKLYRSKNGDLVHWWLEGHCTECPLREQCHSPRAKRARRSLTIAPDFNDRRQRERWVRSEEGRALLRKRTAVEHAIGRVKNHGGGQARYMGRAKTLAQLYWTAAIVNLRQIWNRVAASAQPALATAVAAVLLCLSFLLLGNLGSQRQVGQATGRIACGHSAPQPATHAPWLNDLAYGHGIPPPTSDSAAPPSALHAPPDNSTDSTGGSTDPPGVGLRAGPGEPAGGPSLREVSSAGLGSRVGGQSSGAHPGSMRCASGRDGAHLA